MRVRSWLIRGLILAGVAALAALAWLASAWVSPERVRENVVVTLTEQFDGVDVHVGSARMRIFGGIAVTDLRLTRRGEAQPFLAVPHAVLFHDKEQLNRGLLVIKKVELDNPTIRVERAADGTWNVDEVVKPGPADKPVPTLVVKGATVIVTDRTPGGFPQTTFTNVQGTVLNDPLPTLTVQATGAAEPFGPVALRGRLNRVNRHLALSVELAEFPVGPSAVSAAQRFAPDLAPHLAKLTAVANIKADLTFAPEAVPQWHHDVRFEVKGARFEHPDLPAPLEDITGAVRSVDGRVKVEDATARVGEAKLKLSFETRADPPAADAAAGADPLRRIEDRLQKLDLAVTGVPLDDALFDRLPDKLKRGRKTYSPTGQVDLGYKFTRAGAGWTRELEARPRQAGITYEKFRYPVADVRGLVKRTTTHAGGETTVIDLVGTAAGQLITVKGRIDGAGPDPGISLRVTGTNVPLDESLYNAFPPKYAAVVREFRTAGRGDFVVEVTQAAGVNRTENEFRLDIKDGKLNYTAFPYPLEKLKGRLVVRTSTADDRPGEPARAPDREEVIFDGFTATHGGAPVWMTGSRRPVPDGRDRKLVVQVGGTAVPLDADLHAALAAVKADGVWTAFAPRGALTFHADLEVLDRAPSPDRPDFDPPLDPATDVKVTFGFSGPTVTPKFFPYELTDLSARLEYKNSRLDIAHLTGRHGASRVKLAAGEILFYPDGTIWANLGGIEMKPCVPDAALKAALPAKLGAALEELQLKGGAELLVKHLVVSAPGGGEEPLPPTPSPKKGGGARGGAAIAAPSETISAASGFAPPPFLGEGAGGRGSPPDPVIYWDAELKLFGASFDTGVPWEDAFGSVACCGRYEGTHVGAIGGNVWVDRALVSRVPVTAARCKVSADAQLPDPARPGQYLPTTVQLLNVAGTLFRGELGGQARIVLAAATRYEVLLTATDVQLEEAARHYKLGSDADLKGIAQAQLLLFNKPDPKTGQLVLEGSGKIDVPTGRMYNLPILLDIVKVFKGSAPDKTAFEQAHAVFRIQGDRIKVEQLDLIGKAVCLGGSGELDDRGDYVKFEFYVVWSRVLKEMINTPVGDLTAFVSKNLFTIKMVREHGELKYRPEPVPLVTEPTKAVFDRMRRGFGRLTGK